MMVPCCRVFSVGDTSAWATQFLKALEAASVIEVTPEPSLEKFQKLPSTGGEIPIVFIENSPDSRRWIQALRHSGKRFFLVWYGRGFSKEDFHFAMEHRVYRVLENARAEDKVLVNEIRRVASAADLQQQSEQILRSIKATLLQEESRNEKTSLIDEIKSAVSKLERGVVSNEFQARPEPGPGEAHPTEESKIPFYREQDFGDALSTVHDLERTGILSVRGPLPKQEGRVEFLQGKIVGAVAGQVRGLKAIFRMFLWDQPKFSFAKVEPDDLSVEENLNLSMKYIRGEGSTLRSRFNQIRRELPPSELRLELEPNALHGAVRLPPDDFSTLSSVVEFNDVGRVLDYNPLPDVAIFESLIRLKRNQLIRVATTPARSAA
jgi:hypothetical protein